MENGWQFEQKSQACTAVETFYRKTVDSIMLNHDRLMGVSAFI